MVLGRIDALGWAFHGLRLARSMGRLHPMDCTHVGVIRAITLVVLVQRLQIETPSGAGGSKIKQGATLHQYTDCDSTARADVNGVE